MISGYHIVTSLSWTHANSRNQTALLRNHQFYIIHSLHYR